MADGGLAAPKPSSRGGQVEWGIDVNVMDGHD